MSHTNDLMKGHREVWMKYGCSTMTMAHRWSDKNGRTLIKFLVTCPRESMFIESHDASRYLKDGEKMFEQLEK